MILENILMNPNRSASKFQEVLWEDFTFLGIIVPMLRVGD